MSKFIGVWDINDFGVDTTENDAISYAKEVVRVNDDDTTDIVYICKVIKVVEAKQKITVRDIK